MGNKKDIEKIENTPLTLQEMEAIIPTLISDFCITHNIEDLRKESNNVFNACLQYICKNTIKQNKKLIKLESGTNNQNDLHKINKLLDIYIQLCNIYDSTVTILGFSCFTGIEWSDINKLQFETSPRESYNALTKKRDTTNDNISGSQIYKRLLYHEEQSTLNCKKYNDLRIIARLNRITGGAYRDYQQIDAGATRTAQTPDAIAEKYGKSPQISTLPPTD